MTIKSKTMTGKSPKWLLSIVLAWAVLIAVVMSAHAATTSTFSCFQLSVTSNGNVTIEETGTGWKILAYGTDGECNATNTETVTFTITNTVKKDDGTPRAVSFKITTTGMGTNDTSASKTLDATTTSLTYTATSGKGSSASTTITIDFADISQESLGTNVTTTVEPGNGGTITVDGTAVTAQTDFSNLDDHTYTLTATPSSGYEFFGWMSSVDGALNTDGATSLSYGGKNAATIWPLFVKTGSAVYYIQGASPMVYYGYLDEAITAAGTSGTIVPYRGGTVYGASSNTITMAGQTLLLPISATDLTVDTSTSTDDSGGLASTWQYANVAFTSDQYDDGNASNSSVTGVMEPNTSVYLTLTIPSGTTLNVNSGSKLVIGGTIVSGTSNTGGVCGATAGAHSNLVVNGTLNINSGGILSACGYVLGDGNVNIVGGSAYQPFTLMDYHDGHYTANSTKNSNFPAYRYIMQNIRPTLSISANGRMYGYIDIYTQETNAYVTTIKARHNVDCQLVIGTSSDSQALIHLASGATLNATYDATDYVTTTSNKAGSAYYSKAGKTHLTINGGASLGYLAISVYVPIIGAQTSATNETDFPVPYHYDITLQNGDYDIPYNLVLFPGASMTVEEGADLVVSANKFVVLDGLHDHSSRSGSISVGGWYEYHYPSTANFQNNHSKGTYNGTANFVVDGTFTVNSGAAFGGYIQTNGTGTVVINGTASATAGVGNVNTYGTPVNEYVGRTEHTLSAWLYEADGDLITMTAGTTYYGVDAGNHTIANYDYKVYTTAGDTSVYTNVADETLNAGIIGSWCTVDGHNYASVVTAPTCTAQGYTTRTCSACGHSYTDSETPINSSNHTNVITDAAVAPTCGETGLSEGSHCEACKKVIVAQTVVSATGNHTYDAGVVTPPTATEQGYTTYTCSVCGHSYKDNYTDATGATYSVTITWNQTDVAVYTPAQTTYTWNPESLTYTASTTPGSWNGTTSVMTITVDNTKSTGAVTASFAYTGTVEASQTWTGLTNDVLAVAAGASGVATLTLTPTGTPTAPTGDSKEIILGIITITLKGG